ncbi:AsnC family transcriptional regulator [Paramagnetospirillum marisnigri]|uniref:AsnC family transcriptional regulator n=1 Tax=Paramagnetospirillum marisnigri TaxID=1285242 RepID=A0A178MXU2_9PROT|nr:GntR family transcriptional regulator [Paramagnetospirillum marisnigri]OAN54155.1 AsnC family transcriptional regulator [Paramagnetospirillum marisnigri]
MSEQKRPATRADEIRQAIEKDIFQGVLRPGTRLDEESLAARFGLSRTPVREAILQLVYSGLVVKKPRQGAVVAPLDLHRMVQMFEVMSEIEGLCARYAARRMSPDEKARLAELHGRAASLCESRELDEYYAVNRAFHDAIYDGSHNEVLQDMARSLFARLAPYRRYQLNHPHRVEGSFAEHGEVVAAISAADPDRAQAAMRKHVTIQADIFAEFVSIMS